MSPSSIIPRPRPFNRTPPNHGIISLSAYADLHAWSNERAFRLWGAPSGRVHGDAQPSAKYEVRIMVVVGDAQGRGIGSSRSCTVPGKAESWTLGTNRLQLQQTCRGCRVKRRDQRTETKPAGRTEPSAIFDARRGIKSISGVRGAGRGAPHLREGLHAPREALRDMRWCRTEIHQRLPCCGTRWYE